MELQVEPRVSEFVSGQHKLLIDGEWVDSASGKTFEVINPATEDHLADVAWGEAKDIDRAWGADRPENVPEVRPVTVGGIRV